MKHKHLKISSEMHSEIKREAKAQGMFINEFLKHIYVLYERDKIYSQMFKECNK
jgi:hypothetical protein